MPSDRFGAELRRRRAMANMSLTQLALRVHYDKGHLSKVERGVRPASTALARTCDTVLDAKGALAALVPGPGSQWSPGAPVTPTPLTGARSLQDVLDLFADAGDELLGGIGGPSMRAAAADPRTLDRFRAMFDMLRRHGRQSPPGLVFQTTITQARLLCRLGGVAPAPARARLLALAAYYLEYSGWMAQEAGDEERAVRLTTAAVLLAARAETPQLAPYALVRYSELALYRGEARQAVALAERAGSDPAATTRVRVLAAQRAAQGYALTGAAGECEAALDQATHLLERDAPAANGEIWLGSAAAGPADNLVRGWCYYDLGQPERAAELLDRALAGIPAEAVRARALYGVRLSLARASAGDVEGACGLADDALNGARLVGSATVGHQLRQLEKVLTRWRRRSCVRHVQARMIDLVTPGAP